MFTFILGAILPIFHAEAGFLPTFSDFVGSPVSAYYKTELNTQTLPLLEAATNIDPNPAKGGGDIKIVDGVALASEGLLAGAFVELEEGVSNDQISLYVVREGDTLSQIADMFDVSVNTIRWANDIGEAINPGETLVILPVIGVKHIVEKGETLAKIVKKYEADLDEVRSFNDLSDESVLAVGDELIIPYVELSQPESHDHSAPSRVYGTSGPSHGGYYAHPLPNSVMTQGLHGYNAIDFGAPYGTPIVASASGQVIFVRDSGWNGGYGLYVVIKHDNGTQTLYSHQSRNAVSVGQKVVQGQVIGYVGSTGRSTGNHLHFEVRGAKNPFAR